MASVPLSCSTVLRNQELSVIPGVLKVCGQLESVHVIYLKQRMLLLFRFDKIFNMSICLNSIKLHLKCLYCNVNVPVLGEIVILVLYWYAYVWCYFIFPDLFSLRPG